MTTVAPYGVININKPIGKTSADVVNRVAWLLRKSTGIKKFKAGHCGTLDPLATGVLLVCVGSATRLMPLIQEHSKTYRGRFVLGVSTDTDDITGRVLAEAPTAATSIQREDLERLLPEFTGVIQQVPPKFSAVHVDGRRAYVLARDGQAVEIPPREVAVQRLELTSFEAPQFELSIDCGTGTYIRSIGRDLGERLGCGATMTELARTTVGPFSMEAGHQLDDLTIDNVQDAIESPLLAIPNYPSYVLDDEETARIRTGNYVKPRTDVPESAKEVALLNERGELVAVARLNHQYHVLRPIMLLIEAQKLPKHSQSRSY